MRLIKPTDYQPKLAHFEHQARAFERSRDLPAFGLLMEMGTGKTKVAIDTAAWLWLQGRIDFFFINAPNEVHREWIVKEIPKHLPDYVPHRTCVWSANMRVADWQTYDALWDTEFKGLRIFAVNLEAWSVTKRYWDRDSKREDRPTFRQALVSILNTFKILMVVDESSNIKTPGATVTKRLITAGRHANYRRILTGTPGLPLEVFSQFKFLSPDILGCGGNYYAFKNRYAEWETETNWRTEKTYPVLVGYQRIDELNAKIASASIRVLKKDCLDLPKKTYLRRPIVLAKDQRRIYDQLKQRSILELKNSNGHATEQVVSLLLTRYLRLQQILGGFVPAERRELPAVPLFENPRQNPRIKDLLELIEELGKDKHLVIWARFRAEIESIYAVLAKAFGHEKVVTFYGGTDKKERPQNLKRFQAGDVTWMVANEKTGGYGLDLTVASYEYFYSNDFSLERRLQAEDRIHRIGQTEPCTYLDTEARGTIDSKIVMALIRKKEIADLVTGDPREQWLEPAPDPMLDEFWQHV